MTVGRSWRTPAKHDLMRQLLGKESGVAGRMRSAHRHRWLDLTAGDGVAAEGQDWSKGCSPGILAYLAAKAVKPVVVTAYEIKPATYDQLLRSLAEQLPPLGYGHVEDHVWTIGIEERVRFEAINASGADADVSGIHHGDAVFVLNDPNAITEWAMRPTFAAEIAERTWMFRSLSTLGCNPAGLKRLGIDERLKWFEQIAQQEQAQPAHRDLLLAAIERDDAQWAYLMSEPTRWRPLMEIVARQSFKRFQMSVKAAWWREDPEAFAALKDELFLTKKERAA